MCVCVLSVYLHDYQLAINGAGFLPGGEALWLRQEHEFTALYFLLYTVNEGTFLYEMSTGTYIMRSLCRDKKKKVALHIVAEPFFCIKPPEPRLI